MKTRLIMSSFLSLSIMSSYLSPQFKRICDLSYSHLYSSSLTSILRTRILTSSSVGRALQRYRRGHGFESRSGLNFFQA